MVARTAFCLLASTGFASAQWATPRPIWSGDVTGALGFMPIPQDTDGKIGTWAVRLSGMVVSRPLSSKLSNTVSVLDFGAQCDGATDDTAAVMASMASGRAISVPGLPTVCRTSIDNGNFIDVFVGVDRIMDNIGHLRAPLVHHALMPPGLFGYGGNMV